MKRPVKGLSIALLALIAVVDPALAASDPMATPNHFGLYAGFTSGGKQSGDGRESAAFTIGFDYERRLSPRWGIGVMGDWAFGDRREYILAIPVFLHAGPSLRFYVAPGTERFREGAPKDAKSEFLLRTGLAYDFHFGAVSLSPSLSVDFVHGEQLYILGAAIGWSY